MDPGKAFRICRHTLLILGVSVMAFNQAYLGLWDYCELLGYKLFFSSFFVLLSYLFEGYLNMYVLIPRYFFKGKYVTYFVLFFLLVFGVVVVHYILEYAIYKFHDIKPSLYSYFSLEGGAFWLEFFASYFADSIAILGTGLLVILKHWLVNDRRRSQLEKIHMQTEVEKLKEQVNPEFLFTILHKMGDVTIEDQQRASDMLLELSGLLRYQLYDSNRERVLLNAEIGFITNYLQIEKLYYEKLDFEVTAIGIVHQILVPPLLFVPFVYYAIKDMQKEGEYFCMRVDFESGVEFISFSCDCRNSELLALEDLKMIKQRLKSLYQGRYLLNIKYNREREQHVLFLQINIKK